MWCVDVQVYFIQLTFSSGGVLQQFFFSLLHVRGETVEWGVLSSSVGRLVRWHVRHHVAGYGVVAFPDHVRYRPLVGWFRQSVYLVVECDSCRDECMMVSEADASTLRPRTITTRHLDSGRAGTCTLYAGLAPRAGILGTAWRMYLCAPV